jgi:hypothetical protein
MFSSETLFNAAILDTMEGMSPAAMLDYGFREDGIDQTALFGAYQKAVREGGVTALDLHKYFRAGTLSKLLSKFGYDGTFSNAYIF